MRLTFNRFLTKNELTAFEIESDRDPRHKLLEFLLGLCSRNSKLELLESSIDGFVFPNNPVEANFHLVRFYLDLENHLLFRDPAYIGSKEKLRALIKIEFPDYAYTNAFSPLYEQGRNKEMALATQFLILTLHSFDEHPLAGKVATRWLSVLESNNARTTSTEAVKQIHMSRKLLEKSREIHSELSAAVGPELVKKTFDDKFREFQSYYFLLKNFGLAQDMLPKDLLSDSNSVRTSVSATIKKHPVKTVKVPAIEQIEILEHILDGFVLFDRNGSILDHNKLSVKIFGVHHETIKGKSIFDFLPEEVSQKLKSDLHTNASTIEKQLVGQRVESSIKTEIGQTDDFEITITNNYTEGTDTYSMFLKNITHKKDTLKTIQEAKINAERVAKTKSTFLSNMSHEIRTPLNVILGLSELIKDDKKMNEAMLQRNLDGIDFSAKNLLAIVNDILDFSKIEAGKLSIQSIDFNVRKVVTNLADGFEIKSREKGIELLTEIATEVPDIVIGDQYRLNQILNNLLGNAIKFTKEGQIKITVDLISEEENEVSLRFQVEDSGIGIPKEKLERIFESFYQVEDLDSSKVMGTGLGLTITKELIHLQNGELEASSTPGVGSVFGFTLPFQKSKLTGVDNSVTTYQRKDEQLAGLRILVAEDNQMNQFYIKQLLSKLNVTVDIAENGQEAVSAFKHSPLHYDLIMMDMHMPVMNGIEAIKIIRQSNKNNLKKVPIVACSADVFPEARKEAIKAGIDFYLTKPLSEEAIKEVLFWLVSDDYVQVKPPELNTIAVSDAEEVKSYVDMNMLMETFDNDTDFIITLLEVFIQSTPEDYKSMRHCMQKEFYPRASALAHKLKSSFMNLGMTELGHHLQQIETNALTTAGLSEAETHFKAFNKLYTKALLEVNMLLIDLKRK